MVRSTKKHLWISLFIRIVVPSQLVDSILVRLRQRSRGGELVKVVINILGPDGFVVKMTFVKGFAQPLKKSTPFETIDTIILRIFASLEWSLLGFASETDRTPQIDVYRSPS